MPGSSAAPSDRPAEEHDTDRDGSGDQPRDLLRVRNLSTRFFTEEGQVNAVESVSFDIRDGEVFGVVGESGSGKSVTALSLIDLVETPGRITDGEIWYRNSELAETFADADVEAERDDQPEERTTDGGAVEPLDETTDAAREGLVTADESPASGEVVDGDFVNVLALPEDARRSLRGPRFATVFQDPLSSFDPSVTVGEQIGEAVEVQRRASANPRSTRSRTQGYGLGSLVVDGLLPTRSYVSEAAWDRAEELLELVGIPDPEERAREFPHEFSGGMLQRAMIAQALAGEPDLLIADEPTTALDVTIQAQILSLLDDLQSETGMSVLLITHNLGVIARMCDRVGVMYAGEIAERGTLEDVFQDNVHPYTEGLLGSIPDLADPAGRLQPVEGNVPSLLDEEMGDRCYFADRCPKAMTDCLEKPPEFRVDDEHAVRCVLAELDYDDSRALDDDHFEDGADGPGDASGEGAGES